jgi:diguanylate cyclase (GGDEF)-like protein/PAS domain S-box-containing protein
MTATTATPSRSPGLDTVSRVLLVEDNDGDARLVELTLRGTLGANIALTRAGSLAEALVRLDEAPRDCVVLDLGLPDASGLDALQAILARVPTMAVVVLTGGADAELGLEAVAAGAQDYLVKGVGGGDALSRAIRYAVVRKHGEEARLRSEQTLAEAQRIAQLGSWELDLGTGAVQWSEELCRLYGFSPTAEPDLARMMTCFHREDSESLQDLLVAAVAARSAFDVDHRIVLADGRVRWLRSQGRAELDPDGNAIRMLGTAQNITKQKRAEEALAHQALHDPLTGLPNRTLLLDRLTQALGRLERSGSTLGVLFLDIDRFGLINDSLGHVAGDQMLLAMADRLRGTLRTGDTLARFGGDEFVLLCEGLVGELEALGMAEEIKQAMVQPLSWGGGELVVTVSTGIATASSARASAESLLRDADAAMYRAKEIGRAQSAVFARSMRARAIVRLNTESSLRRAITEGELEVNYQPIVTLPGTTVSGMEALVRWRHPTRGLLGPDEFIAVAEETGLIVPLGAWVLREAVRQAVIWQRLPGHCELQMSVNLSARQVAQPDLVELVAEVLETSGLAPRCLELEITESVLMGDAQASIAILSALKQVGVGLGVDDFGTGYSSLAYLKRFPVDELKIDRSFVDGLGADPEDTAIVRAIVSLAGALNLTPVAEGVETSLQLETLLDLGCGRAQGYLFARPGRPADVERMLAIPRPSARRMSLVRSAGSPSAL